MTRMLRDVSRLLLIFAAAFPAVASAQTIPQPARMTLREPYQPIQPVAPVSPDAAGDVDSAVHVALVGAVAAPGAYVLHRPLSFGELIDATGGTQPDSSSSVLLIRQGRPHTLFYDPAAPVSPSDDFGRLREGDVVVLRSQPGVRRAVYETTASVDENGRPRHGVENAHRDAFVHVACIGLAPHPVVLPLNPHQATQHVLLRDMLGMSDETIRTTSRILTDGGRFNNDGSLQDGTVIVFDLSGLKSGAVRPIERFPEPRELPAAAREGTPVGTSASPRTPPGIIDQTAAPYSLQAPPTVRANGGGAVSNSAPAQSRQHLLNQPLYVPGLPFECFDRSPATAEGPVVDSSTSPIDMTEQPALAATIAEPTPPAARSQPHREGLLVASQVMETSAGLRGIRPATAAPPVAGSVSRVIEIEGSAAEAIDSYAAVGPTPPVSGVQWNIVIATAFAGFLGLLASYLWARAERKRRGVVTIQRAQPTMHTDASGTGSPLQDLVERRLPLVEEQALGEPGARLHGPVLGHRKLYFDLPHRSLNSPHFTAVPESRPPSAERIARHVGAARRGRARVNATVGPEPNDVPASVNGLSPPRTNAVRYDVVQPDMTERVAAPVDSSTRRTSDSHDLLTRVLTTLGESH